MVYFSQPWNSAGDIGKAYNDFMALLPFDEDFACFIDADATWLTPNFGKQIEDIIVKYPECGLFTCMTNRVKFKRQVTGNWDSNDIALHREIAADLQEKHYDEIEELSNISLGCLSGVIILIRKSVWKKLGGFSNGFLGVDNDIHIEAYKHFEPVYLMKGVYVYHWYRGGQIISAKQKENSLLLKKREAIAMRGKTFKKVIYTAITGNYEPPLKHQIPPGWEFKLFTNQIDIPGSIFVPNNGLSDVKLARRIKILPWEYFDFDVCLWIDGNTVFNKDKIEELTKSDFVISKHPERDCIYDEGEAIIKFGKDSREQINRVLKRYEEEGFPKKDGLVASHAILRKNTPEIKFFCEEWWKEVLVNSHRDQMAFNYVLWKNPIAINYIPFKTTFRPTYIHRNRIFNNAI